MSGGFFNYEETKLIEFAEMIYQKKEIEEKQLSQILKDLANVLHEYDYYKSGDTDKAQFIKSFANFLHKYNIKFMEKKQ